MEKHERMTMKSITRKGVSAGTEELIFSSMEHKFFFLQMIKKCRKEDVYHRALIYCLGIDRDTRERISRIYDFKTGYVRTECLKEGWQTSGSRRIVLLAFNLYTNSVLSVCDYDNMEEQLAECMKYSVEDLFCCVYAPYFWQAVKIRYPEFCQLSGNYYIGMEGEHGKSNNDC